MAKTKGGGEALAEDMIVTTVTDETEVEIGWIGIGTGREKGKEIGIARDRGVDPYPVQNLGVNRDLGLVQETKVSYRYSNVEFSAE